MDTRLIFRSAFDHHAEVAAHALLLHDIFGYAPERPAAADPAWVPFAYFDQDGRCVASVEAAMLRLLAEGRPAEATAIRLAGVAATHRGLGLFRDLMTRALAWCGARGSGPALLYTAEPALYTRFDFRPLAQHAFVGAAPEPAPTAVAERLDGARSERLLDALMPTRAPLSHCCAILGAHDLLRENLRREAGLLAAHAADLGALIIHEGDDEALVLVDVIATVVPTMAQIVGALRSRCRRVRTLFPPDRLAWAGTPEPDDTGLMARGPLPEAMTRPFMLPPTMGF